MQRTLTVDLELNRIWYILFQVDLDNEEFRFSPVLAPTLKDAGTKEELTDTTPAKSSGATGRSTPASATPSKGKRKASTPGEETKINTVAFVLGTWKNKQLHDVPLSHNNHKRDPRKECCILWARLP